MAHTLRRPLTLSLATFVLTALAISVQADRAPAQEDLDVLLARFDRQPDGPAREALAAEIDAAAHQKYATVSRLYWYTDLASAEAVARKDSRPILHLRMLGRLDEDFSCANSRLFRATLYANQDLSKFLRERFVLYWSSERPVPHVTIDYGDGRKIEGTITGNSAHYVLDEDGRVLDVLPGLYAADAFRRQLEGSLALFASVRGQSDAERAKLIAQYHQQLAIAAKQDWDRLAGTRWIAGADRLLTPARLESEAVAAQRATVSKMVAELPRLRTIAKGLAPEAVPEDQIDMWSVAGQGLFGIGDRVLDDASRALVVRLHNEVTPELRATGEQLDAIVARLEQTIAADSALNQLRLRPQIEREIVRRHGRIDFTTLNAWIYADVFRTPSQDAWLGLLPRNVFTGLPGDGVVIR